MQVRVKTDPVTIICQPDQRERKQPNWRDLLFLCSHQVAIEKYCRFSISDGSLYVQLEPKRG
jgi:hypothetical protein